MVKNREFTPDDVALRSNFLTVNKRELRAAELEDTVHNKLTVNAEELARFLRLGRRAILLGIEDFFINTSGATVRPSIFTLQLGDTAQTDLPSMAVFTEQGHANGGVITLKEELQPAFGDYWDAVTDNGFAAEVRRTYGKKDGGSWMLLRNATKD